MPVSRIAGAEVAAWSFKKLSSFQIWKRIERGSGMQKLCIHRYLRLARTALYQMLLARAGRILSNDALEKRCLPLKIGR